MDTHRAPLATTVDDLRRSQSGLASYVEEICRRIDQVDPAVQALLPEDDRPARLQREAQALAAHYPYPSQRPPLYGALVGVKDIFHVNGFTTRAGSALPPERFAGAEARCVTLLREAGALILGKTVTTEFAYFEPGPTRNPHNLLHTPGGSSSGSAAAVATGLCTLALGTQTIGSVIRPAAFCGVVGFKPSLRRIPTAGIVYFSRTIDHVGLFTQDVTGMELAASVLCDKWRAVSAPSALPVVGVPDGPYLEQAEMEGRGAFEHQLDGLRTAGCTIRRVPILADIVQLNHLHRRMIFAEFAQEHAALFTQYEPLYRPRTAEAIRTGQGVAAAELAAARAHTQHLRRELETAMDATAIDLWACPAALGPAPAGIDATGDPNMNLPWTHAGLPAATIPAGRSEAGLPLGLQLVARFGHDEELLGWAQLLSQCLPDIRRQ